MRPGKGIWDIWRLGARLNGLYVSVVSVVPTGLIGFLVGFSHHGNGGLLSKVPLGPKDAIAGSFGTQSGSVADGNSEKSNT